MELIELFLAFAKISLLSFGGGWTMLAIMEREVVAHQWMTAEQFSKTLYVVSSTPGPVAVSSASVIGQKVGGVPGMIVAVLGIVLPPIALVMLLYSAFTRYGDNPYFKSVLKGIAPVVVALVAYMAWRLGVPVFKEFNLVVVLLGVSSLALLFAGVHPGWLILGGGLVGLALLR
jgi:chromate transporter